MGAFGKGIQKQKLRGGKIMAPKKIAIVITHLQGNGAERFVITLAEELIRQGHTCHIFCFKSRIELPVSPQLNIHLFPMKLLRWIPRSLQGCMISPLLDRFISKHCKGIPDLTISSAPPVDKIMCQSGLPNVYMVIHTTMSQHLLNGKSDNERSNIIEEQALIYCRKPAICVSDGVMQDFKNLFPSNLEVSRIYNPVNHHEVQSAALGTNPIKEPEYFVHVGKFNKAKRHDRLLRAYAKSGVSTPLVLIGKGPLMEQTISLAKQLNISERVIFTGFHQNPYPTIAGAKAMIVSSDYEGLGLVILEALALNVPVISTDCPSGPREILPYSNLVSPLGEYELSDKIRDLSKRPDAFHVTLSNEFSPERAAAGYLALAAK